MHGLMAYCHEPLHLVNGVFCERMCVAKANVELVGASFRANLIQNSHHPFPLGGGPALDGGPPTNLSVLFLYLGGSALGYQGGQLADRGGGEYSGPSTPLHCVTSVLEGESDLCQGRA